jgi:hypothetical protein
MFAYLIGTLSRETNKNTNILELKYKIQSRIFNSLIDINDIPRIYAKQSSLLLVFTGISLFYVFSLGFYVL